MQAMEASTSGGNDIVAQDAGDRIESSRTGSGHAGKVVGTAPIQDEDEFEAEPTTFDGSDAESESEAESDSADEGYDSDEKAMVGALAPLMLRKKTREELIDSGYNRHAHNDDQSILPKWFLEDEQKHCRPNLPITKEEANRIRDEQREIDNRPIKKVAEARARKKRKTSRSADKVRAKAEAIAEADDVSAKAKNRAIEKLNRAAKQKKPEAVYQTVSKGGKSQTHGKGGGRVVKVDRRMKADKRGKQAVDKRKAGKRTKRRPRHGGN
eukprot:SAG11_NODE_1054_length_6018_cov_2.481250_2_plen_268_part_00